MEVDIIGPGDVSESAPGEVVKRLVQADNGAVAWLIDCACEPDPDDDSLSDAASAHCVRHLALAHALDTFAPTAGICLLTRGTQAVLDDESPAVRVSAAMGLSRTIGNERGGRALRLDLDPRRSLDGEFVVTAMAGDDDEVAVRDERALVPRVHSVPTADQTFHVRRDGSYLVTGGSGALGMLVAEWLASQGAGHIVLLGRRAVEDSVRARIRQTGHGSVQVVSMTADVGDYQALASVWRRELTSAPPLRGVVHTAGVLDDAPLAEQSAARLRTVALAKIDGSWNLHRLSAGAPLDFFVLFSSAAAWFGNPGQANYAAANAFLDGLAEYRQRRGLPATSIAWGPWDDGRGMAARASDDLWRRWTSHGLGRLRADDALRALARLAANQARPTAVVAFNQARFVSQAPPLVQRLFGGVNGRVLDESTDGDREIAARLRRAGTPGERRMLVSAAVRHRAARILGLGAATLDDLAPLVAYGLDSLMAVQLKNALHNAVGVAVSVSQVLRSPSLRNLSDLVATAVEAQTDERPSAHGRVAQVWEEGSL
jgi:NAD(P)-dependent dehydrogenase (short-subunit alcohol dehydrogenase family)/aryl carrier-like protein